MTKVKETISKVINIESDIVFCRYIINTYDPVVLTDGIFSVRKPLEMNSLSRSFHGFDYNRSFRTDNYQNLYP